MSPSPTTPLDVDPKAVLNHLKRIEESEAFNDVEEQRWVLRFVVEETLAGRGGKGVLTSVKIAKEVFGEGDGQIARTHFGRLRRTLLAYYRYEPPPDEIEIKLPERGYTPTFSRASNVLPPASATSATKPGVASVIGEANPITSERSKVSTSSTPLDNLSPLSSASWDRPRGEHIRLAAIEWNLSPDGGDLSFRFCETPADKAAQASEVTAISLSMSIAAVELVAACSGISSSDISMSKPRPNLYKYGNKDNPYWFVGRSLQSMVSPTFPWKNVIGLLHFRDWSDRHLENEFFDLFITPFTEYEGSMYIEPSYTTESAKIAIDLVPLIRPILAKLISWETGDAEVSVALAEPVWQSDSVPIHGGDAFVFQGIITDRHGSA